MGDSVKKYYEDQEFFFHEERSSEIGGKKTTQTDNKQIIEIWEKDQNLKKYQKIFIEQ